MNRSVNETVICPHLRKRKVLFCFFLFQTAHKNSCWTYSSADFLLNLQLHTTNVNVGHCLRAHLAWYEVIGHHDWAVRGPVPIRKADWGSAPMYLHTTTPADMLSHIHTWLSPLRHLSPADQHHGATGCHAAVPLRVWAELQRSGARVVRQHFYQSLQFIRRHHAGGTLSHQPSHQQPHPEDGAGQHQLRNVRAWPE